MAEWLQKTRSGRVIRVEGVRAKRQRNPVTKLFEDISKMTAMHDAIQRGDDVAFYRAAYGAKAAKAVQLWQDGEREQALAEMKRLKFPHTDVYQREFDAVTALARRGP